MKQRKGFIGAWQTILAFRSTQSFFVQINEGRGTIYFVAARYSPALGDMKSGWAAAGGKGAPLPAAAQKGLSQGHREGTKIFLVETVYLQYYETDVYERMPNSSFSQR
jgi:hypothetical protein